MIRSMTRKQTVTATQEAVAASLSANIRRARQQAGITQTSLADRCHVSRNPVRNWEVLGSTPSLSDAWLIADALGIDVNDLRPCVLTP